MKLHKNLWMGCTLVILLLAGWVVWHTGDVSPSLDPKGSYSLWNVPITKKLAYSLKNCSFYRRTYREPAFYQMWNNRFGHQDILAIRPGLQDTCVLIYQTSHLFSPFVSTKKHVDVPRGLTRRVGEIFLRAFENTPQAQEEIHQFAKCVVPYYDIFQDGDIFGAFEMFTHSLEDYLEEWDRAAYQAQSQRASKEQKEEEKRCHHIQKKLPEILAANPQFSNLDYKEKMDLAKQALPQQYGVTMGGGGSSYGYNKKKNEGSLEVHSAVSRCEIDYNPNGIISARFIPREHQYRLPRRCW